MARTLQVIALVALVPIAGCERERIQLLLDGGLTLPNKGDTIPGASSLRIEPASAVVTSDGRAPGERIGFRAFGRFEDGERDLTDRVRWSISELGSIELGEVVTSETIGGTAVVRASAGGLEASAELTIMLDVLETAGDVPADIATRFPDDMSTDATGEGVELVYPAAETTFPSNIERVRHQWRSTLSAPLYEVRFESSIARIRIHTRQPYYQLDDASSGWIPRTHAGRSVTMTVRAIEESGGTVQRSSPRSFRYARSEIAGEALYWSTTSRAIMRASLASPRGTRFLPAGDGQCVSCHAVSRDGARIAAALGEDDLGIFRTEDLDSPISIDSDDDDYAFSTFSPDGDELLVAEGGRLTLYDLEERDVEAIDLGNRRATHPDWSPDGRFVAVAITGSEGSFEDKDVRGTSLARIEVEDDGDFGELEILVAPTSDGETLCFPSYSPDGKFLAFVRTTGSSKDNDTSEIHLIAADGSAPSILLASLDASAGNTIPTWAPTTDPSTKWITFSSIRDYGNVLVGLGRDQLWASAIDVDLIAAGSDPSSPAFWLPFQDAEEHNHRALWIPALGATTPGECTPAPETCNGSDDDCDLVTDEGCDCGIEEICGNSLDDDCDERTDSEDEDCGG